MKLSSILSSIFVLAMAMPAFAQSGYVGTWKTIDDRTGNAKSHVEIYQQDGKLHGKIVKIIDESKRDKVCKECTGNKKNQPLQGLVILENLQSKGDYYGGGLITDPENGKEYRCYIELEGEGKLKVRGFVGVAALGRTQYWHKVN